MNELTREQERLCSQLLYKHRRRRRCDTTYVTEMSVASEYLNTTERSGSVFVHRIQYTT